MRQMRVGVIFSSVILLAALLLAGKASATGISGSEWLDNNPLFIDSSSTIWNQDSYEFFSSSRPIYKEALTKVSENGQVIDKKISGNYSRTTDGWFDSGNMRFLPDGESHVVLLNATKEHGFRYYIAPNSNTLIITRFNYGNPIDRGRIPYSRVIYAYKSWYTAFSKVTFDESGNQIRTMNYTGFDFPAVHIIEIDPAGSLAFSGNGRWMYFNPLNKPLVRMNLDTFEMFPFTDGDYRVWIYPDFSDSVAISDSGRYIALLRSNNEAGSALKIYDLKRCDNDEVSKAEVLKSAKCESIDLGETGKKLGFNGYFYAGGAGLRFVGEDEVRVYNKHYDGWGEIDRLETSIFSHIFKPTDDRVGYLALGDSFSSGEGARNYREGTDIYNSNQDYNICHQSTVSYPYLLSNDLKPDWFGDVACSGAVTDDIYIANSSNNYNPLKTYFENKSQAKHKLMYTEENINKIRDGFTPGYIPQINHVDNKKPAVVTISIGGNDIGFKDIIMDCIKQLGCYKDRDEREKLADMIDLEIFYLTKQFKSIKSSMSPRKTRLYVLGYPKITSPDNRFCSAFGQGERERLDPMVDYLNAGIKTAAERVGARYTDVTDAFITYDANGKEQDHRLCGNSNPAVNGITFYDDPRKTNSPMDIKLTESYHPNTLGQVLLAKKIRALTNDLSLENISENNAAQTPSAELYKRFVGDNEDKFPWYETELSYSKLTNDSFIDSGTSAKVAFTVPDVWLSDDAQAQIELHSDPVSLGTVPIKSGSQAQATIQIPESTTPGYHQLHILFTTEDGYKYDQYQYIYVAASPDDYDGDGILNDQDHCIIGGELGIDRDQDGLDDGCERVAVKTLPGESETDALLREAIETDTLTEAEARTVKIYSRETGAEISASSSEASEGTVTPPAPDDQDMAINNIQPNKPAELSATVSSNGLRRKATAFISLIVLLFSLIIVVLALKLVRKYRKR